MIGCVKHFDSNKTMSFKVSDNKLLKKYNKIWEKISNLLHIKFDSQPVSGDGDKYIKKKIKMYGDRVNTRLIIMLDSVIRANKQFYPQTLLEECKYVIRKNNMENLINHDLNLSSSDESDSDNESDNESDN